MSPVLSGQFSDQTSPERPENGPVRHQPAGRLGGRPVIPDTPDRPDAQGRTGGAGLDRSARLPTADRDTLVRSSPVSIRSRYRSRCRSGIGPVSVRFRSGFGPGLVQVRSGRHGRNRDNFKMQINAHGRMLFPKPNERGQGGERHPWQILSRKQFAGPIN